MRAYAVRSNPVGSEIVGGTELGEHRRGHLKIYFSYAAGTGKTCRMLRDARYAMEQGTDVAVGFAETWGRKQTAELLSELPRIPFLELPGGWEPVREFNLDLTLKRKPDLVVVDDLAHTNVDGCRHNKRYQDVEELLQAGIDVYATLNVQNIESLNDIVEEAAGIQEQERIPDSVFDDADQVEFVDMEPRELIERLNSGGIYEGDRANLVFDGYFTVTNLRALRKIAMRRYADRLNRLAGEGDQKTAGEPYTKEHILVCLSSSPSNKTIIRTAARMAQAFRGSFTALFVETPEFSRVGEDDRRRLEFNTRLARQLGATVETVYGEDISYQIAEFARLSGITRIVIGRSTAAARSFPGKQSLTERLITYAPGVDIHIIPDQPGAGVYREKKTPGFPALGLQDILKLVLALAAASGIGLLFEKLGFTEANIITVYILSVLIVSVVTTNRLYCLLSSMASVIVYNFLFTEPKYSLFAYDISYPVTFFIMFLAALITGSLAAGLKSHARQSAQTAYRTKILFDTDQLLGKVRGSGEILSVTAGQLVKLLGRDVVAYQAENGALGEAKVFPAAPENHDEKLYLTEEERSVAEWVFKNNKHAGATTETLSGARCLYLAVRVGDNVYGVVGIAVKERSMDSFENGILLSILGECALALENDKNARGKEEAAIMAKNEQLRSNILRVISHDLRTPLTSISGNASNLLERGETFDEETKKKIYSDICEDSAWLISLVENLLSVTRFEEGRISLRTSSELMDEVITEALQHVNRRKTEHRIMTEMGEGLLMAKMDARLMVQVVINLVDNAIKYTPEGSEIVVRAEKTGSFISVSVEDDGPGISPEDMPHIFELFYSGNNPTSDSRRSLGLGLALCKAIVTAHGGEITAAGREPHGTRFTFTLPAEEIKIHE